MTRTLSEKYRPQTWDDVYGHEPQIKALKNALAKGTHRAFLFTGGSGLGKTTLARIAADAAGCQPGDRLEIDAATYTGIDDMREVTAGLQYRPLGTGQVKAVVVDEFHALSKAAVQSLLKILEEPPEWVYWFLCTTEPTRVLPTIITRCFRCDLKPVPKAELVELLTFISKKEKLVDGPHSGKLCDLCATEAEGSPRQALANLALCAEATTIQEAYDLLRSAQESAEAVELARALVKGAGWAEVQRVLGKLGEANPESVRHVVRAYITKVIINAKSEQSAGRGLEILDAFSTPFHPSDGISPLVMACGKAVLS